MKIGSIDILKAYLGALELTNTNAFVGNVPVVDAAPVEPVPYDELWYTTSDGNIITPYDETALPTIVSNTYEDGRGVIRFNIDLTEIGASAFSQRATLTSVEFPNCLEHVGASAFAGCSAISRVGINDIDAWCSISFENQTSNPIYYSKNLYVNGKLLTDLVIDGDVSPYIFYRCESLKSVTITNNCLQIGTYAFGDCSNLTSVTIGNSVTSIEVAAFIDCSGLTSIAIPDSVTIIGNSAFSDCSGLTSVTIGNNVTTIGMSAFNNCNSLTSVTIPDSVTVIDGAAFKGCSSLTSVMIPHSVTTLGMNVFQNCGRLVSAVLHSDITTIPVSTFHGCHTLESITIPSSVTTINANAFTDCVSLPTFTIPSTVTTVATNSFTHVNNITHSLGTNTYGAKAKDGYVDGNLVYYDSTKTTLCGCFGTAVGEIVIPNTVTTINQHAFYYCDRITSVVNLSNITKLENYTFSNCKHMESITIPSTITKILTRVFENCHSLTSVTVPNSVTSIGTRAFGAVPNVVYSGTASGSPWNAHIVNGFVDGYFVYENSSKTDLMCCSRAITNHDFSGEIVIPDGVVNLRRYSMQNIVEMTSVVIPASVTHFYEYMLNDCDGLTNITFLGTIAQWNAITKDTNWSKNMNVTVAHCSDGDVQIA